MKRVGRISNKQCINLVLDRRNKYANLIQFQTCFTSLWIAYRNPRIDSQQTLWVRIPVHCQWLPRYFGRWRRSCFDWRIRQHECLSLCCQRHQIWHQVLCSSNFYFTCWYTLNIWIYLLLSKAHVTELFKDSNT